MLEQVLIEEIVAGALEMAGGSVRKMLDHRTQKKRLASILQDYSMRAHGIPSNINLPALFADTHRVEELMSHALMGDVSREQAITIFLEDDADENARDLARRFYNEVNATFSDASNLDVAALQPNVNRTANNTEELLVRTKEISTLLATGATPDTGTQLALLEEAIRSLEADTISIADAYALANSCGDSLAGSYLQAYLSLCNQGGCPTNLLKSLDGRDSLLISLAAPALSAGNIRETMRILEYCSTDLDQLCHVIESVFLRDLAPDEPVEVSGPSGIGLDSFIKLTHAEKAFSKRAFSAAELAFDELCGIMNPVARLHQAAAIVATDAYYSRHSLPDSLRLLVETADSSFSKSVLDSIAIPLELGISTLEASDASKLFPSVPQHLSQYVEPVLAVAKAREAPSYDEAMMLLGSAIQAKDPMLFVAASERAKELNPECVKTVAHTFVNNRDWLFTHPIPATTYIREFAVDLTHNEYVNYFAPLDDTVEYHLLAYEQFHATAGNVANEHMTQAISMLRQGTADPCLTLPDIWIPYLVKEGREGEVLDIVRETIPHSNAPIILHFLGECQHVCANNDLVDRLVELLANAELSDTRLLEYLARYFAVRDDIPNAGRLARRAFDLRKSETSAELAVQWMLKSSMPIDEDVRGFVASTDTQRMNLLAASIADAERSPALRDRNLIRAAFRDGDDSNRALALYAMRHADTTHNDPSPDSIQPDTCIEIKGQDGTVSNVFFFSESDYIADETGYGPAGFAFSTSSQAFIANRGNVVGDAVALKEAEGTIVSITSAQSALAREGFKHLAEMPQTVTFHGTPEETIERLAAFMKSNTGTLMPYLEGFSIGDSRFYPGIESARQFGAPDRLEFTIEAIANPGIPFRRNPVSKNAPVAEKDTFLLSYSATICLALLDVLPEEPGGCEHKLRITESTARRLANECGELLNSLYDHPKRLTLIDEKPVIAQYDESATKEWRDMASAIMGLVERLQRAPSSMEVPANEHTKLLGDNAAIDIQTARETGCVYVTEDYLEGVIIDLDRRPKRCSISVLLAAYGLSDYIAHDFLKRMKEWQANPVLEVDIVHAIQLHSGMKP